jgi:hypothetical protein
MSVQHFVVQMDHVVGRTRVNQLDMGVLVFVKLVLHCLVVVVLGVVFDFLVDLRVLCEDFVEQEFLAQSERFHCGRADVDEFSF